MNQLIGLANDVGLYAEEVDQGTAHGLFAGTALVNVLLPVIHPRMGTPSSAAADRPLLEPPGFMLLNYGRRTPVATVIAHVAYGTIVGGFISLTV